VNPSSDSISAIEMERKLKSLFRRSGQRSDDASSPRSSDSLEQHSPQVERYSAEPPQHGDQKPLPPTTQPQRSLETTSPDGAHTMSVAVGSDGSQQPGQHVSRGSEVIAKAKSNEQHLAQPEDKFSRDQLGEQSIADDYVTYITALSPNSDPHDVQYMTLGGDTRLMVNTNRARHNEDIADRNIERFGNGSISSRHSSVDDVDRLGRQTSLGRGSFHGSLSRPAPGIVSVSRDNDAQNTLTEFPSGTSAKSSRSSWPPRHPRDEAHMGYRRRRSSTDSMDDNAPRLSDYGPRVPPKTPYEDLDKPRKSSVDGVVDSWNEDAIEVQRKKLDADLALESIVDLRNTVDVNQTTRIAPGESGTIRISNWQSLNTTLGAYHILSLTERAGLQLKKIWTNRFDHSCYPRSR
jgi:hypothetical protein